MAQGTPESPMKKVLLFYLGNIILVCYGLILGMLDIANHNPPIFN